jgi:uncharacterized protein DUF6491
MRTCKALLAAILIAATLPAHAAGSEEKACLQSNRIWGWQAVNDHTLIITDRAYRRFTVSLRSGCIGLADYAGMALTVRTTTSLGCLAQGDMVRFNSPALGRLSCVVSSVRPGVPKEEPGPDAN